MLHIVNGDITRESIERSTVPGRFTVWGDVLYQGPVPREVGSDMFAQVRARFHAGPFVSYEDALAKGRQWNEGIASYGADHEVVLWFEHDLPALPFLDGAMRRMLEDFPDARTGLPRTERTILEILASSATPLDLGRLFALQQQTEERVFMGDWTFWGRLEDLARGSRPLVAIDGTTGADRPFSNARVGITPEGRHVLAGDEDWARIAPFDRWVGGTHLVSPFVEWRWNGAALEQTEQST